MAQNRRISQRSCQTFLTLSAWSGKCLNTTIRQNAWRICLAKSLIRSYKDAELKLREKICLMEMLTSVLETSMKVSGAATSGKKSAKVLKKRSNVNQQEASGLWIRTRQSSLKSKPLSRDAKISRRFVKHNSSLLGRVQRSQCHTSEAQKDRKLLTTSWSCRLSSRRTLGR